MSNSHGGAESVKSALRPLAFELLRAVDDGLPLGGVARELAVEALRRLAPDTAGWTLAVAVLEGGPLRARRAVELAGVVLDEVGAEVGVEEHLLTAG